MDSHYVISVGIWTYIQSGRTQKTETECCHISAEGETVPTARSKGQTSRGKEFSGVWTTVAVTYSENNVP